MDYVALIHTVIDSFVEDPSSLIIRNLPNDKEKEVSILICAKNEDISRLIGKKGCIANSIRDIVNIAGKLNEEKVHLKFESFSDNKEE